MYQTMSLPLYSGSFEEYHGWGDLRAELAALGCDGMEGIWSGEEFPEDLPADLVIGYHLAFYPDWLDFYRDDRRALKRIRFTGCCGTLLRRSRAGDTAGAVPGGSAARGRAESPLCGLSCIGCLN